MAEELQELKIFVRIDKDTKKLELVNAELKKTTDRIKASEKQTKEYNKGWKDLATAFGVGALAAGGTVVALQQVIGFMRSSIKEAMEEIRVEKELATVLTTAGESWEKCGRQIIKWTDSIEQATRFSHDEAKRALMTLIKFTGDLTSAKRLLNISMDVASATEKDLTQVTNMLGYAMVRPTFGLRTLKVEFGAVVGKAKTTQEAILLLEKQFKGYAEREQGVIKAQAQLRNQWALLKETIGIALLPAITLVTKGFTQLAKGIIASMQIVGDVIAKVSYTIYLVTTGKFKEIKDVWKTTGEDIVKISDQLWKRVTKTVEDETKKQQELRIKNYQTIIEFEEKAEKEIEKLTKTETEVKIAELNRECEEARRAGVELETIEKYKQAKLRAVREEEAKKQEEEAQKRLEEARERLDIELGLQEEQTKALTEGTEKRLAETDLAYKQDLEKYRRLWEDKKLTAEQYEQATTSLAQQYANRREQIESEHLENLKKNIEDAITTFTNSFNAGFEAMLIGGQSFKKGMNTIWADMRTAFIRAVTAMIAKMMALLAICYVLRAFGVPESVTGKVIGEKLLRLQEGGIIEKPTIAVLGEKGPEAVVPLARGTTAPLPIESRIGNINVYLNIDKLESLDKLKVEEVMKSIAEEIRRQTPIAMMLSARAYNLGGAKSNLHL